MKYPGDHRAKISANMREQRRRVMGTADPGPSAPVPRPFFCRTCGLEQPALQVPEGWYSLERHKPRGVIRLGLYCSTRCLVAMLPRLEGIGAAFEAGSIAPEGYRR